MLKSFSAYYEALAGKILMMILISLLSSLVGEIMAAHPDGNRQNPNPSPWHRADSLTEAGKYQLANAQYAKILPLLEKQGYWEPYFEVSIKIATNKQFLEAFEESKQDLEVLIPRAKEKLGANHLLVALAYHKMGVYHYYQDHLAQAIHFYRKAINIREEHPEANPEDIIKGYRNIAENFSYLGELDSALFYLELPREQVQALKADLDPQLLLDYYHLWGRVAHDFGDLDQAKDHLEFVKAEYDHNPEAEQWRKAIINEDLALLYAALNWPDTASRLADQALNLIMSMEDRYYEDTVILADIFLNKGNIYKEAQSYDLAATAYRKALQLYQSTGNNPSKLAGIYNNLATLYNISENYRQAIDLLERAIALSQTDGNRQHLAQHYDNLGDSWLGLQSPREAIRYYDLSIQYSLSAFDPTGEPLSNGGSEVLTPLSSKARTLLQMYYSGEISLSEVTIAYQQLDELITKIRQSYHADLSKISLAEKAKPIYEQAIAVCLEKYGLDSDPSHLQAAFFFAEKSKSVILLEAIRHTQARRFAVPANYLRREKELKLKIKYLEKRLRLESPKSSRPADLQAELLAQKNQLGQFTDTLETHFRKYHQLKYDLNIPSIEELQARLAADEALVEYFVGRQQLYAFVATQNDFKVIRTDAPEELPAQVDSFRLGLTGRFLCHLTSQRADRLYTHYGYELYRKLLLPLALPQAVQRLQIIPDEVLGYLPFEALLSNREPDVDPGAYQHYPYLSKRYIISYQHSAAVSHEAERSANKSLRASILAFAPSQASIIDLSSVSGTPGNCSGNYLPPLIYNREEILQLRSAFSGKFLPGPQATAAAFLKLAPRYRILHFSGHGKVNDREPNYSFLLFATGEEQPSDTSFLYIRDLYDENLPADLVVLSACETSLGKINKGEGIISLARAFTYAGAKSIITSYWSVNQQTKSDLINDFYRYLREGQSKDEALWQAKQAFLQKNTGIAAHPFYWAGFVPIGDMEKLDLPPLPSPIQWNWWILPVLLGVGLGWTFFTSRRRSSSRS